MTDNCMKNDINRQLPEAIRLLQTGGYTCVLCSEEQCLTTTLRGVKPLVKWLRDGAVIPGFSAADKVVGKATAFLYCLLGAKAVYANVMSRGAKEILENSGIYVQYGTITDYITNRTKDGICPFEAAVLEITEPQPALAAIYSKMEQMGITLE